jgi:glycosyltransferase involved in cell wall biosynthesis
MEISVVIPTFNRRRLVQRSLEALAGQDRDDALTYEVLVCDDGSSDGTEALCRDLATQYPVDLTYLPGRHSGGPSIPRNEGTSAARGGVVLFVDDDAIPSRDLLMRHARFHREHPASHLAAIGRLVVPPEERGNAMAIFSDFPYDEMGRQEKLGYLFFWTGNVSVKRGFMLEHGAFRPDPSLYPIEDMDCGYRLFQGGMDLRYLPDAWCSHVPTLGAERVVERGRRTGMAQFALWQLIGDPAILRRFGVLAPEIGWPLYAERAVKRLVFRLIDQPLVHASLRALGATTGRRSRWSDVYYYLVFRRHMIAGYREARARHRRGQHVPAVPVPVLAKAGSRR